MGPIEFRSWGMTCEFVDTRDSVEVRGHLRILQGKKGKLQTGCMLLVAA